MNDSIWFCERCGNTFNSEEGEGGVTLTDDINSHYMGKLAPNVPPHRVCYECADDLFDVVKECAKNCLKCEASTKWGLSIGDCLKFQLKFEVIDLPNTERPLKGSIEEAKEILQIFGRF